MTLANMKNLAAVGAIMAMIGLALIALAHGMVGQADINAGATRQHLDTPSL